MMRATDLMGCRVVTESGESRGRVYELRAADRDGGLQLIGLGVSTRGLLERFGVAGARRSEPVLPGDAYAWDDVLRLEDGRVVVRDTAQPR
jgi:hypothetical protein